MKVCLLFLFLCYLTVPAWGMEEMERDNMTEFSGPGWEDAPAPTGSTRERDVVREALRRMEEQRLERPPASAWKAFPQTQPEKTHLSEKKKNPSSWKETTQQHPSNDLQNIADWFTWENITNLWNDIYSTHIPDEWKKWVILFVIAIFLAGWILYLCIDIFCFFGQIILLLCEKMIFFLCCLVWRLFLVFLRLPWTKSGITPERLEKLFFLKKN